MPKFYEFMKLILSMLKCGDCIEFKQIREMMNQRFTLTDEEVERKINRGRKPDISEDIQRALLYLTNTQI